MGWKPPVVSAAPADATMDAWSVIASVRHTAASLQQRADQLLRGRGLTLTQVEILTTVDDRRRTYAGQIARDVRVTRQSVHRSLFAALAGVVGTNLATVPPLLAGVENAARRPTTSAWGR
jgi:hypothetical protein